MSDQKILLVNDENSPLLVLKNALARHGYDVTTCTTAFDCLDELRSAPPDIVVASVKLPDMSGFHLSSLIKTSECSQQLPVALVGTRDELADSFWKRACLADITFELKDVEFDEDKSVARVTDLMKKQSARFNKESLREHALFPAELNSRDFVASFRELLSTLLMERSVSHFSRSLMSAMGSRVEFMTRFFTYMKHVFGSDITGLLVADPQSPWGIVEISGSITKGAFDKLQASAAKSLAINGEPRLITHGEVAEKGGSAIKASEIVPVYGDDGTALGGVVLGWTAKQSLDEQSKAVCELLKTHMPPVFRSLFDKQEIQLLKQAQTYSSSIDPITGLYNVEFLIGFLQQQLLFSARQKLPVGLIMLDVDRFLEINQEFGPETGDMVLTSLAQRIGSNIRSSDLLARYSGDQFAIVLPNTDLNGSQTVAEKLRSEIEQMQLETAGKKFKVTVSVGCSMFRADDANPETILRDAKLALMSAKEAGRNRVAV